MATRRRSRIFTDRTIPAATPPRQQVVRATIEGAKRTRVQKQRNQKRSAENHKRTNKRRNNKRRSNAKPKSVVVPQRDHEGKTIICMASGPSLTPKVLDTIRPYHAAGDVVVAGLNDVYRICDFMDEFYACDQHWWKYHLKNPQNDGHLLDSNPDTRIWGNQTAAQTLNQYSRVSICMGSGARGFSEKPELIHWGSNSGYQLLNLMWHLGGPTATFLLVGYNMQVPNKMGTKGHHFFGPHPKPMSQSAAYKGFVKQYHTIQGHIKKQIINCTTDSALDCFHKSTLEEELFKASLPRVLWEGKRDRTGKT